MTNTRPGFTFKKIDPIEHRKKTALPIWPIYDPSGNVVATAYSEEIATKIVAALNA